MLLDRQFFKLLLDCRCRILDSTLGLDTVSYLLPFFRFEPVFDFLLCLQKTGFLFPVSLPLISKEQQNNLHHPSQKRQSSTSSVYSACE